MFGVGRESRICSTSHAAVWLADKKTRLRPSFLRRKVASAVRGDGPAPFHLLLEIRMGSLSHHRRVTINAHSNLPCFSIPCKSGSERESDETATFTQLSSPAELRGTDVGHRHPLGHG